MIVGSKIDHAKLGGKDKQKIKQKYAKAKAKHKLENLFNNATEQVMALANDIRKKIEKERSIQEAKDWDETIALVCLQEIVDWLEDEENQETYTLAKIYREFGITGSTFYTLKDKFSLKGNVGYMMEKIRIILEDNITRDSIDLTSKKNSFMLKMLLTNFYGYQDKTVVQKVDQPKELDYGNLSDKELEQLEEITAKAQIKHKENPE